MSKCTNPELGSLLHAYEINALSDKDFEQFEIHLISCEYCFKEVQDFEAIASNVREDEEVKTLVREAAREPAREPGAFWEALWRYLWPEAPLVMKPALAYLLVLALLVPAYQGFRGGEDADPAIHPVQIISCFPLRDAEAHVFTRGAGDDGMISFYYKGAIPGNPYQVIIQSVDGTIVFQDDQYNRFDEHRTGWLLLPLKTMSPGKYLLSISDTDPDSPDVQDYYFLIED